MANFHRLGSAILAPVWKNRSTSWARVRRLEVVGVVGCKPRRRGRGRSGALRSPRSDRQARAPGPRRSSSPFRRRPRTSRRFQGLPLVPGEREARDLELGGNPGSADHPSAGRAALVHPRIVAEAPRGTVEDELIEIPVACLGPDEGGDAVRPSYCSLTGASKRLPGATPSSKRRSPTTASAGVGPSRTVRPSLARYSRFESSVNPSGTW